VEIAALDQAVDAAEQGAFVGAFGRPQKGDHVDGQHQEEDAHRHASILSQLREVLGHGAIVPRCSMRDKIKWVCSKRVDAPSLPLTTL
jgi:hypothetical protein